MPGKESILLHPLLGPSVSWVLALAAVLLGWYLKSELGSIVGIFLGLLGVVLSWYLTLEQTRSRLEGAQANLIGKFDETSKSVNDQVKDIRALIGRTVEIHKFDTPEKAMKYVVSSLGTAAGVLDVRVHTDAGQNYGDSLSLLTDATAHFLGRGGRWTQFVGSQYEEQYTRAISNAIKPPNSVNFHCRRLKVNSTPMNFMILNYGSNKEVLFGWGQEKGVFSCKNQDVVSLFSDFAYTLKDSSQATNLLELIDRPLHPEQHLSGLKQFWFPHFRDGARTAIVYTEPMFFRVFLDPEHRFFIRDIDINDTQSPAGESHLDEDHLKDALKKKLDWPGLSDKSEFEVSRAYVPGGEAFAKDNIVECFQEYGRYFIEQGTISKPCECKPVVFHEARWFPQPGKAKSLRDDNLVMLGNSRANPRVQSLHQGARYVLEPHGITIANPTARELEELAPYIKTGRSDDSRIELNEKWKTESMVLVTRGPGLNSSRIATSILANQGRGVHAVAQEYLTNTKNEEKWQSLVDKFGLPTPLPRKLQMLFHVELTGDEARWDACDALACDYESS